MATIFERYGADDIRHLIDRYPLAWVVTPDGEEASLLPLVGVFDGEGALTELIGHFACTNPLRGALAANPKALILFKGPDAYLSPNHAGRRDWGPTWNYAQLRVWVDITVDDALTKEAVDLLVEKSERTQDRPWQAAELGPRHDQMIGHIIGFRARVTRMKAVFKLGQDERPETLRHLLTTLPDLDLVEWMRRFNPGRS